MWLRAVGVVAKPANADKERSSISKMRKNDGTSFESPDPGSKSRFCRGWRARASVTELAREKGRGRPRYNIPDIKSLLNRLSVN